MQTPIGEGLGSSDALAPVAALSVDEGAPLTPAAVRGAGIIGGSGLDYSQSHAPSSALTEAEVQSPVVRPADLHKQELLQGPGLSAADLADDGRSEKILQGPVAAALRTPQTEHRGTRRRSSIDREQALMATRLQAVHRGSSSRKASAKRQRAATQLQAAHRGSTARRARSPQTERRGTRRRSSIDREQMRMATRLQAVHRGRTSRRTHVTAAAQQRSEQLLSGLDPIIMKINQKIAEGHSNVMAEFRDWDTDRNNQVTKAEFKAALAKMGYEPSKAELAAFFKRFDKDDSGFIAYAELNKVLKEPPKKRKEEEATEFKPAPADEREVAALRGEVERLRALLLEKAAAHQHDVASLTAQLESAHMTADVLRRRLLDKSTFETAVYFDDPAAVRGDAGLPRPSFAPVHTDMVLEINGAAQRRARLMEARAQAEGLPKAVQLERAGAKTPKEAKERGFDVADVHEAGLTRGLKEAGFTAREMREGATPYLVEHVRRDGFSLKEAHKGEITLQEWNTTGQVWPSLEDATAAGYELVDAFKAGYTVAEAHKNGHSATECMEAGCVAGFKAAGYTCKEVSDACKAVTHATASDAPVTTVRLAGYSAAEAIGAALTVEELRDAGYTFAEVAPKVAPKATTPRKSVAAGSGGKKKKGTAAGSPKAKPPADVSYKTIDEAKAGGYVDGCKAAGYTIAEATAAGYTEYQLKECGFSLAEAKAAGYSPQQCARAGYSLMAARSVGYWVALAGPSQDDQKIWDGSYLDEHGVFPEKYSRWLEPKSAAEIAAAEGRREPVKKEVKVSKVVVLDRRPKMRQERSREEMLG